MTKSILERRHSSGKRPDLTWPCDPSMLTRRTWAETFANALWERHRIHSGHRRRTGHSHPPSHCHDKYGRTIADVLLPDETNLNYTYPLIKDGWCWWYRKYAPGDTVLEGLENEAREGRKGLWLILIRCHRGNGENAGISDSGANDSKRGLATEVSPDRCQRAGAGGTSSVHPCPDQSPSRLPFEMLTPQFRP